MNTRSASMPPGLNEAFVVIYRILTIFAALVFVIMTVYSVFDLLKFFASEVAQRVKRTKDPNLFNKDTTDVEALAYVRSNSLEDEPYHIFQQQKMVSFLFIIAGIMVMMLGIQLGTFFSFKFYAVFTQKEFKEQVDLPMKMLATMVVLVVAALMVKGLYKKFFIKKVRTSLKDLRAQMREVRSFIYQNLTTNGPFLAALRTDNIDDVIDTINSVLKSKNANACMNKMTPCDGDVESMVFTMNLYSHLKMQVPESDPNYDNIRKLFDVDSINTRAVDPTLYFYYKQPTYIANLYPIMRDKMKRYFGKKTGKDAPEDYDENPARERIFFVNLNSKMQDLNAKLSRIYNITSGKSKVRNYLFASFFYLLLFAAILIGMYFTEAKPYLLMAYAALSKVLNWASGRMDTVAALVT